MRGAYATVRFPGKGFCAGARRMPHRAGSIAKIMGEPHEVEMATIAFDPPPAAPLAAGADPGAAPSAPLSAAGVADAGDARRAGVAARRVPIWGAGARFLPLCALIWAAPSLARLALQPGAFGPGGPLLILVPAALWLGWRAWPADAGATPGRGDVGGAVLLGAILLHAAALLFAILIAELLAIVAVVVALLYAHGGLRLCRRLAVPLLLALAALPLPASVIGPATFELKMLVARASVALLDWGGWEAARSGSALYIGPYELTVEAACAGVNSALSLVAIGLFYAHLRGARGTRMALLVAAAVPVAVTANVLRVVLLGALVAQRGVWLLETPLHPLTGLAMFAVAVLLLMALDRLVPSGKAR